MVYLPLLAAEGGIGATAAEVGRQFGFNGWLFLSQAFSFSIVCLLLYKFAYKPILTVLEQRRKTIEQGLEEAARIKQELAATEKRTQEMISKASADSQRLIEEARAAAKNFQDKQSQQAIAEAERIIAQAREATQLDRARMMVELKREVARLVVDTTAKVTGKVLTPDDQRRLSEEASREIAA
ncbi:F0F1 ATP synthase subunit B [Verrucomicrobiota bacterium sgz303538]